MSIHGLFHWAGTIKNNTTKRVCRVQSGHDHHLIEMFLALLNDHSSTDTTVKPDLMVTSI
jgi:hypothetical protein